MFKQRSKKGIHSLELVGGLIFLVPICLYGLDYAVLLFGQQMSTSSCSAATRAAANGPPTGCSTDPANTPTKRASVILKSLNKSGSIIRMKQTVKVNEQVATPVPSARYGGPIQGAVTVKTRCDVYPPILLPFVPKQVTLLHQETYPWTYMVPSNFNSTATLSPTRTNNLSQAIADSDP